MNESNKARSGGSRKKKRAARRYRKTARNCDVSAYGFLRISLTFYIRVAAANSSSAIITHSGNIAAGYLDPSYCSHICSKLALDNSAVRYRII